MKRLIIAKILLFFITPIFSQTVDVDYLDPQKGRYSKYKYLRFGNANEYWAGFMWNNSNLGYGDGNDFCIYTYGGRDITFRTGGKIILYPKTAGKVGIGTTNPSYVLDVNGDFGFTPVRTFFKTGRG